MRREESKKRDTGKIRAREPAAKRFAKGHNSEGQLRVTPKARRVSEQEQSQLLPVQRALAAFIPVQSWIEVRAKCKEKAGG